MNLEHELEQELLRLKKQNQKLTVKWDAGGDDTSISFFVDEKYLGWQLNEMYAKLETLLIKEFDLPNVGEYFNKGQAEFQLSDNGILITYSELAYAHVDWKELNHKEFSGEIENSNVQEAMHLLSEMNFSKISFYGNLKFMPNRKEEFQIQIHKEQKEKIESLKKKIQQYIFSIVEKNYDGNTTNIEILFSGNISKTIVTFEEISVNKNMVDKNYQNVTIPLFDEEAEDF